MKLRTSGEDELAGDSADFDQDDLAAANAEQPTRRREPEAPEVREARCREAAAILQEVIDRMKITATVTGEVIEDDTLLLKVVSEDSAILIGRKGRTLSALQFIINRMVAAGEAGDLPDRIVVDVEGYLDRRRESLEDMALHLADKAKQTGRNMRVKPLNPQERRIIHLKLQDDPEVRTFSLGESLYRSVIIAPKSGGTDEERPRRSRGGRGGRGGRWRDNAGGPDRDNATSGDSDAADSISAPVETATVDHAEPDES
jgi:spoIIIJ-associated protein